jgi:hypothetical protein
MTIDVSLVLPEETLAMRELYRKEMNCQIVRDSWHGRGWTDARKLPGPGAQADLLRDGQGSRGALQRVEHRFTGNLAKGRAAALCSPSHWFAYRLTRGGADRQRPECGSRSPSGDLAVPIVAARASAVRTSGPTF